jgi:hypothetical protein
MPESTQDNNQEQDTSPLGMSDGEFEKLDPNAFEAEEIVEPEADAVENDDPEADQEEDTDTDEDEAGATAEASDSEDVTEEEEGEAAESESEGEAEEGAPEADKTAETEPGEEADKADTTEEKAEPLNYEAEYNKLLAPFRANGKEMQVKNTDEAMQLMKMGANYNKKMAGLKPSLKTVKLLENNGLLDEGKLNYLIDLHKKDPGAIKQLIKDSGVDPLDVDTDADSDYKPNTYNVDDREMELDEVLESIADSPTYSKTIGVVSNKWDEASKQTIANNPQVLTVINDHVASGIYEQVSNEVERERALGRLKGLSDYEAYSQTGDAMHKQGKFVSTGESQESAPPAKQKVVSARKAIDNPALKSKKRAASSTKAKPAVKAPDINPLAMSDEEYEKQYNDQLM